MLELSDTGCKTTMLTMYKEIKAKPEILKQGVQSYNREHNNWGKY